MPDPMLSMRGITKRFPGVLSLDKVDLDLSPGEVLALVGENGAGKSTLLKVLSGAYKRDEGSIRFDGEELPEYGPKDAIDLGVSIIYQELDNFPTLSVAENILVNDLPRKARSSRVDWGLCYRRAKEALARITDEIDPRATMGSLSAAQQQLVEIAKALYKKMRILVMDEPTSALNRVETERLLKLIRSIADSGVGVIYISHRMDEIFAIADRIQVMRDGRSVALLKAAETARDEVVRYMVGRTLDEMYPHVALRPGREILKVEGLSAGKARDVSFVLHEGEILGLFGLMGAGRTDLVRALFGDLVARKGRFSVAGEPCRFSSPVDAIRRGIAYVPSERKLEGLMRIHSVQFNTCISCVDRLMRFAKIDAKRERSIAERWIDALKIRAPSPEAEIEGLSGGNQQKVVIAKWLEMGPKVLILNDPTRGIDVGAKVDIYNLMEGLCKQGLGIVMISSELQETIAMSDRILVMCEGALAGEVGREDATQESLMKLAVGEGTR